MDDCIISNGEVSTTQHPQTTAPTIESTKEKVTIKMDDDCIDSDGEVSYTKTADRKSPPELEHPFKTIPANPELANKLVVIAKKLFKINTIKVVLDDAGYSYRLPTNNSAVFSTWPCANNHHAVISSDEVRPVVNMTKDQILRAGLRTEGERIRVCLTYAFLGVLSAALTTDAKSGHKQTKEFDKKSGSTGIDEGQEFAKPLISESLRMR